MKVSNPYNATLLGIIARKGEINYFDFKKEYCVPTPPGVILGINVMFDSDLNTLESEGYIQIVDEIIIYIGR